MALSDTGVILITAHYPFDRGEEFLESEIEHLAREFDEVIILPLSSRNDSELTRSVPSNVHTVLPSPRVVSGRWRRDFLRFTFRHPLRLLFALGSAARQFPRIDRVKSEFQFAVTSDLLTAAISNELFSAMKQGRSYTIYAYWFHVQSAVGVKLHRQLNLPVVARGHRGDIYEQFSPLGYLPRRRQLIAELDGLYAVSRQGATHLKTVHPDYADRISVARLGVNSANNSQNSIQNPTVIVTCSRIVPVKRLTLAIAAIANLQQRGRGIRWVHLGGGVSEAFNQLHAHASRHLQPGSFSLVGELSNQELREWYANHPATLFLNVSESEGVPVSIMEALAQGLPIIATDVGGTSELIAPEIGMFPGLLSSDPSPSEIADRIEHLLELSNEDYAAVSNASFLHWKSSWSAPRNYARFAALLSDAARPFHVT